MRKFAIGAALVLAGCVSNPGPNGGPTQPKDTPSILQAKESARAAFENFRKGLLEKDPNRVLSMMSRQLMTNWVYTRMADQSDELFKVVKDRLDSGSRIELDYWFRRNKDLQPPDFASGQPALLPDQIFASQWIVDLWTIYYKDGADQQKRHAEVMEIGDIYPDGNGVTIMVRIQGQTVMMYGMVNENATWKLDHYVQQPTKERR